jgi:hypothetical protein
VAGESWEELVKGTEGTGDWEGKGRGREEERSNKIPTVYS